MNAENSFGVCLDIGNVVIFPDGDKISKLIYDKFKIPVSPSECEKAYLVADRDRFNKNNPLKTLPISMSHQWSYYAGIPEEYAEEVWDYLIESQLDSNRRFWTKFNKDSKVLFEFLKANDELVLAAVSNTDGDLVEDLKIHGIYEYFSVCIDSQIVGVEKPSPTIYKLAAEKLGIVPENCIYIGDTASEVYGAINAGFGQSILVDWLSNYDTLVNSDRIKTVNNLDGVISILENIKIRGAF